MLNENDTKLNHKKMAQQVNNTSILVNWVAVKVTKFFFQNHCH